MSGSNYDGLTRNSWPGTWSPSAGQPIVIDKEIRGSLRTVSGQPGDRLTDITGQRLEVGMLVYLVAGYTVGGREFQGESYYKYDSLPGETRNFNTGELPNSVDNWSLLTLEERGEQGFTGSQGEQGFTGSQGEQGFTGSQGEQGFTGSQGDLGYTGSQGEQGFAGSIGLIGSQGEQGYTGSQGEQGYTGSQGEQGYTGSQGVAGYTGSQGDIGYTGSEGYTGSQGEQGYTGSSGTDGIAGRDGYTGSQGDIGYTGSQGFTGSQGETGAALKIVGFVDTVEQLSAGYQGSLGDAYVVRSNLNLLVWDSQQWVNTGPVPGANVGLATRDTAGIVRIGDNININNGTISVPKGAGINKVVDIPDVNDAELDDGSLLFYNEGAARWETKALDLTNSVMDGGFY